MIYCYPRVSTDGQSVDAQAKPLRVAGPEKLFRETASSVKMRRAPKLTAHQKREAIKRRDHGEETLAEIGKGYNVSGWTIARLT
jgi:hypothetical protein